jgi:hypothetical protein
METNKYYTPTTEEFHVGFEYEIFEDWDTYKEKQWFQQVYGEHGRDAERIGYIDTFMIKENWVRVKYLDQEDIESLGWKEETDSPDGRFSILKDDIYYYLIKYGHNHKYEIRCMHPSYKYGSFLGIIKNKSELRKIMKQIGI